MSPVDNESASGGENVRKILKRLQQVKAPDNFEAKLFQKINSAEFTSAEKKVRRLPDWKKIFSKSTLVPSAALAIVAVIILYIVNLQPIKKENPFAITPELRNKVVETDPFLSNSKLKNKAQGKEPVTASENNPAKANKVHNYSSLNGQGQYGSNLNIATASMITKSGLNFRHICPTAKEKKEVYELKKRLEAFFKDDTSLKMKQ